MEKKANYNRALYSLIPWVVFVLIMASAYFLNASYNLNYSSFGIYPREFYGLKGILFSPFIHGSIEHLGNNTLPILILGTAILYFYGRLGMKVIVVMYLLTGILVWLSARESYHIGASGLIYAFAGFLFMSGILRKAKNLVALSLLVAFLYGGLFWGIFPVKEHISWESHLWGGVVGVVIAWYYRKEGPQRKRYTWEDEEDDDELLDTEYQIESRPKKVQQRPPQRLVIKYDFKEKKEKGNSD